MNQDNQKTNMNKTWLLIALLIVLTAILLALSIRSKFYPPATKAPIPTATSKEITYATLKLAEEPRISSISGRYEIDVDLATEENKITIVQLELGYDPNLLRIYDIAAGNFIKAPEILEKEIDAKNGTIKFWLAVDENQGWIQGEDSVATITFTKIGTGSAEINFRPKTSVNATGSNHSVLKDLIPGIIEKLPTPSLRPTRFVSPTTIPNQVN